MSYVTALPPKIKSNTPRRTFLTVSLILAAVWVYLVWIARSLEAAPFDTYEIYLDAKLFAGLDHFFYQWKRPPFLPWLLTPFFHSFTLDTAKTISQILAVSFYGGLTLACYKIFRLFLDPLKALLGAALLALNPLTLHHAPFLKEDIAASTLATLAFWLYLKARMQKGVRLYTLAGLVTALAGITRYNMLPWMLATFMFYELLSARPRPFSWKGLALVRIPNLRSKIFFLGFFPCVFFWGIMTISWAAAIHVNWLTALRKAIETLQFLGSQLQTSGGESPLEYAFFLWKALTGPGVVLCVLGILVSWRRKFPGALWMNVWLFVFSLQQCTLTHHEARYLFPAFPPICFFIITGASALVAWLHTFFLYEKMKGSLASRLSIACLVPCVLLYGYFSVAELLKFQDPFYRTPYMKSVSLAADALAQGKNVFWVGYHYPLHPKEFLFHPQDEVGYVYHFYNHTVRFYTGNFVAVIATDSKRIYEKDHHLFLAEALRQITDGDVLILNPNFKHYNTIDLPGKILPLFVQKCRVFAFQPLPEKDGRRIFVSENTPGSLQSETRGLQLRLEGADLPDGTYELYGLERAGDEPYWIETLSIANGRLPPLMTPNRNAGAYFLLSYTPPIVFPQP